MQRKALGGPSSSAGKTADTPKGYLPHILRGRGRIIMENRVAVLAIIVRNGDAVAELNALLHQYGEHIIGRMGLPRWERGLSLISVALDAPGDVISALSGKIGRLPGVTAKTVYAPEDALR